MNLIVPKEDLLPYIKDSVKRVAILDHSRVSPQAMGYEKEPDDDA